MTVFVSSITAHLLLLLLLLGTCHRLQADWIMNLYWVAKALIKVRRKDEARSRLQQALALPVVTAEDRTSVEKVKALLETL